jgi:hypothetical protein
MIAYAGLLSHEAGVTSDLTLAARPRWPLDTGRGPLGRVGAKRGQGVTRLAIYGAGAFGSALAMTYAAAGLTVTLWARAGADRIAETRETPAFRVSACPTASA